MFTCSSIIIIICSICGLIRHYTESLECRENSSKINHDIIPHAHAWQEVLHVHAATMNDVCKRGLWLVYLGQSIYPRGA